MKKILVIVIIIAFLIIGFFIFQFSKQSPYPQTIEGNETLEITVLDSNNNSVSNLEVDLWTLEKQNGPPSAGILSTNNNGKVLFKIPEGNYLIGFNSIDFPEKFEYPSKTGINVKKGENKKIIILNLK